MKPCPCCGAPYGNQALRIDMRSWRYGHTNLEVKDIKDKVALFFLSREGDIVTLDREVVAEKEFTMTPRESPLRKGWDESGVEIDREFENVLSVILDKLP